MDHPVLITGGAGLLGSWLIRTAPPGTALLAQTRSRALPASLAQRATSITLQLDQAEAVARCFDTHQPRAVVHTAAQTNPGHCEKDPAGAQRDNVDATRLLAQHCSALGIPLLVISTDLVFDGHAAPYKEDAPYKPVGVYAETKAEAERVALATCSSTLIARAPLLLGASPAGNRSADEALRVAMLRGDQPSLFVDEYRTPIHAKLMAQALWKLLELQARGIYHVAGHERVSRYELGVAIAKRLKLDATKIKPSHLKDFTGKPPRCPDVSMDVTKLETLLKRAQPTLAESLNEEMAG